MDIVKCFFGRSSFLKYPNIVVGIKDSSGNVHLTAEYIRRTENEEFKVMAGRDTLILGSLVYGAVGAVASTANVVPELVVSIYENIIALATCSSAGIC